MLVSAAVLNEIMHSKSIGSNGYITTSIIVISISQIKPDSIKQFYETYITVAHSLDVGCSLGKSANSTCKFLNRTVTCFIHSFQEKCRLVFFVVVVEFCFFLQVRTGRRKSPIETL